MASLYVTGARQKNLLIKKEAEQNLYEKALILRIDTDTGDARVCVEHESPPGARAGENSSNVFKSGTLVGGIFYSCTSTEVILYRVPSFEPIVYLSLPWFNDLHHVCPSADGNLLVVNTGLDQVLKISREGRVLNEWSVLETDTWTRFSRATDYRKVESTKPHEAHPNFVFELAGEVWVTRFHQRDSICLTRPGKRIDIAVQRPHDGLRFQGKIYFTTVDGHIVIVDETTLAIERAVDLNAIGSNPKILLGWCRGLLPDDQGRIWVGFTRVRKTRFTENLLWVKHKLQDGRTEQPTHLARYDLRQNICLQQIDLEQFGMNVVFSIFEAGPDAIPPAAP